jgi:hypothetical protein
VGYGGDLYIGPADDPDRYQLWRRIGTGGEGTIWQGTRKLIDGAISVAVKQHHADRFGTGTSLDALNARLETQAARLRQLHTPGLVAVHESFLGSAPHPPEGADESRSHAYFVMEYVDGESLPEWARTETRVLRRLAVLEDAAAALDVLHRADQVHADVKPSNLIVRMVGPPDRPQVPVATLVDFGVMRAASGKPPTTVVGSEGYLAPELRRGAPYTPASDLYAFAMTCAWLLGAGHPGDDIAAAARDAGLAEAGVLVLTAGIHADPDRRADELAEGIAGWLSRLRSGLSATVDAPVADDPADATVPPAPPAARAPSVLPGSGLLLPAGATDTGLVLPTGTAPAAKLVLPPGTEPDPGIVLPEERAVAHDPDTRVLIGATADSDTGVVPSADADTGVASPTSAEPDRDVVPAGASTDAVGARPAATPTTAPVPSPDPPTAPLAGPDRAPALTPSPAERAAVAPVLRARAVRLTRLGLALAGLATVALVLMPNGEEVGGMPAIAAAWLGLLTAVGIVSFGVRGRNQARRLARPGARPVGLLWASGVVVVLSAVVLPVSGLWLSGQTLGLAASSVDEFPVSDAPPLPLSPGWYELWIDDPASPRPALIDVRITGSAGQRLPLVEPRKAREVHLKDTRDFAADWFTALGAFNVDRADTYTVRLGETSASGRRTVWVAPSSGGKALVGTVVLYATLLGLLPLAGILLLVGLARYAWSRPATATGRTAARVPSPDGSRRH